MAFFKKKKKDENEKVSVAASVKEASEGVPSSTRSMGGRGLDRSMVLIRPHVTEKATDLSGRGVYAFDIHQAANKMHVRDAIEKLYKVKPTKINIMNKRSKLMKNPRTGRIQVKQAGVKKALVYLKSGDKIEFV